MRLRLRSLLGSSRPHQPPDRLASLVGGRAHANLRGDSGRGAVIGMDMGGDVVDAVTREPLDDRAGGLEGEPPGLAMGFRSPRRCRR